jgi:hypothetical protein
MVRWRKPERTQLLRRKPQLITDFVAQVKEHLRHGVNPASINLKNLNPKFNTSTPQSNHRRRIHQCSPSIAMNYISPTMKIPNKNIVPKKIALKIKTRKNQAYLHQTSETQSDHSRRVRHHVSESGQEPPRLWDSSSNTASPSLTTGSASMELVAVPVRSSSTI